MSPSPVARWRTTVAVFALVLIAGIAGFAFWPSPSSQTFAADGHGLHAAGPVKKLDPELAPATSVGNSDEVSLGEAASIPTADDPVARDTKTLEGKRTDILPETVLGAPGDALGGCLVEYGKDGQCLPVIPPSQAAHAKEMTDAGLDPATMEHTWSCKELRAYFPKGIEVRQAGVDPQALDRDENGVACSSKD